VMWCDAILIPVCDSRFDRDSASACHEELAALPRVANGRCKVGVLGMRVDRRTRGHASLESWAAEQGMDFLGSLRDTQLYVNCADRGLTVFDLPASKAAGDVEEWKPVLAWLEKAAPAAPVPSATAAVEAPGASPPPPRMRRPALSTPSSLEADVSELTLSGVAKPGFWGALRRFWRR
jgi:chromosome partitioning protein